MKNTGGLGSQITPKKIASLVVGFVALLWPIMEPQRTWGQDLGTRELRWVFMVTGKPLTGATPNEIQSMMQGHLGNFQSLLASQDLITCGPLNDPQKVLRGIALLNVPSKSDTQTFFANDPFVKNDAMKLESCGAKLLLGSIDSRMTPEAMDDFTFALFKSINIDEQPQTSSAIQHSHQDLLKQTLDYLKTEHPGVQVKAFVELADNEQHRTAICIFQADTDERIKAFASGVPFVQAQLWSLELLPIQLSRGLFDSSAGTAR